jgi:hypothetical protein
MPRTTESPSTVLKRSFDMPRYDDFKDRLAERDSFARVLARRAPSLDSTPSLAQLRQTAINYRAQFGRSKR